jgi:protein gp37
MINQTHFVGSMPVADKSSIEWTEATWNPTTGCNRTSPGCDNCYALTLSRRLKAMGNPKYQNDGDSRTSGPGFGLTLHPEQLDLPHRWAAPRVIFVNSMSDLFHPSVPLTFIREVFEVMRDTPRHTYQVLTKRSARLEKVGTELSWPSNIWMGVSIESNKYVFRADHLRQVPAAVRFISAEPLLGSLSDLSLTGIDWLIAGGESGNGSRPMHPIWARQLRDRCSQEGTAFFFKQWGSWAPVEGNRSVFLEANGDIVAKSVPNNPEVVKLSRVKRSQAGRHLDGKTWDEMPEVETLLV